MTKTVEVLDALMGSGKTTAIIKYMAEHQEQPWLYISPMLEEVDNRVPQLADELGLDFHCPEASPLMTKTEHCLRLMRLGKHICCTHNLMYKFTPEHIEMITKQGYRVVSDEELNLIQGYSALVDDIEFLLDEGVISIDEETGKVEFLNRKMTTAAKYGDFKSKADLGMLYAAKRSFNFMVVQLPPVVIDAADRFILLTYNYKESLMETFLKMHGYNYKEFNEVQLYKSNEEIIKELSERIVFVDNPSLKKIHNSKKYSMSKSWWISSTREQRKEISKLIRACMRSSGVQKEKMFYTIPKDFVSASKGFETKFIGSGALTNSSGEFIESTRNFIACNARSTNAYADKELAVQGYNLYPNQSVKAFIQGQGYKVNDDLYALNMLLQWLFRGCIRKKDNSKMYVAILPKRMNVLFKDWLIKSTSSFTSSSVIE